MYIITIRKLRMSEKSENLNTSTATILILKNIIYDTDTFIF